MKFVCSNCCAVYRSEDTPAMRSLVVEHGGKCLECGEPLPSTEALVLCVRFLGRRAAKVPIESIPVETPEDAMTELALRLLGVKPVSREEGHAPSGPPPGPPLAPA